MKCPMLCIAMSLEEGHLAHTEVECLKEECAWWNPSLELCCVRTISWSLAEAHNTLRAIRDNMPHEKQFRK